MRAKLIPTCLVAGVLVLTMAAAVGAQDDEPFCFVIVGALGGQPEELAGVFVEPLPGETVTVISWEAGFPEIEPIDEFDNPETGGTVYTYEMGYAGYLITFSTSEESVMLLTDGISQRVAHACLDAALLEATEEPGRG
jgi:hypothetical protein